MPDSASKSTGMISQVAADAISIASSIAAGAVTGWVYVERSAYKNMSSLGAFDDMKPKRKAAFDEIERGIEHGKISQRQSFHLVDGLIESNEREARNRLLKMGIHNFGDRWNILRTHQKMEAGAYALIAGGVAIGSVLQLTREFVAPPEKDKTTPGR